MKKPGSDRDCVRVHFKREETPEYWAAIALLARMLVDEVQANQAAQKSNPGKDGGEHGVSLVRDPAGHTGSDLRMVAMRDGSEK